jgi:hypothetical protein
MTGPQILNTIGTALVFLSHPSPRHMARWWLKITMGMELALERSERTNSEKRLHLRGPRSAGVLYPSQSRVKMEILVQ